MRNEIKISSALLFTALLAGCGQSGPLYMPGHATGIHKKDEFIFGGDQNSSKKPAPAATKEQSTPPKAVNTPTTVSIPTETNTDTNQTVNSVPVANAATNPAE